MDKLPFAPYDFFGYLASGFALLAGMQLAFGFPPIFGRQQTVVESLFLLLIVYVVGHVLATPAKAFWEDLVVDRLLRRPNINLLRDKRPLLRGLLFPGYYKPLPSAIRSAILDRAHSEGVQGEGEELFLHVRYSPDIRSDEKLIGRLDAFRNQYGFNRNLSFTGILVGCILMARAHFVHVAEMRFYGMGAIALGLLLFYRYLKFFRQYSYELFNHYRPQPHQGRLV
jgi:hypothetical protein